MNQVEVAKEWCWGCRHDDPICSDEEGYGHWAVWHKGEANGGVVYQCTAGERDVYLRLIELAEWAGPTTLMDHGVPGSCPWCGAIRDGSDRLDGDEFPPYPGAHKKTCRAAKVMNWRCG